MPGCRSPRTTRCDPMVRPGHGPRGAVARGHAVRQELGLSQRQFAQRNGVTQEHGDCVRDRTHPPEGRHARPDQEAGRRLGRLAAPRGSASARGRAPQLRACRGSEGPAALRALNGGDRHRLLLGRRPSLHAAKSASLTLGPPASRPPPQLALPARGGRGVRRSARDLPRVAGLVSLASRAGRSAALWYKVHAAGSQRGLQRSSGCSPMGSWDSAWPRRRS
jgi:hypothetical protein